MVRVSGPEGHFSRTQTLIVNSKWVHTYKGDEYGNFIKAKSRLCAKGSTQVQDVDYHETTSPTPTSAPVKTIAVIVNELDLPVIH